MSVKSLEINTAKYPINLARISSRVPAKKFRITNPVIRRLESPLPQTLYQLGDFANTKHTSHLAIIGSRKMPEGSIKKIEAFLPALFSTFAEMYPHVFLSIISGLTSGGDAAAHWTTLAYMHSFTSVYAVGVSATSINHPHAEADEALFDKMLTGEKKGVISEHPDARNKVKETYYDRNRLTAWMSGAVLIYGVSRKTSGAMHTMSLARQVGIPVFYLMGTISNSVAVEMEKRGCIAIDNPQTFIDYFSKRTEDH